MTTRRHTHTLATPDRTGGDDRPQGETVVPQEHHHQIARRLARRSRVEGAEAVLAEVEDLMWDDVPFVAVALARMAWAGPRDPKPTRLPGITDDARAAHALFERFRKLGGEIPISVREGEREYQAMRYQAKRKVAS